MNSAVQGIRQDAMKHSRRAARLWKESAAIFDRAKTGAVSTDEAVRKATELSNRAADEFMQAVHSIEFLQRYRESET
jgi:hypothetical protein